jgi:hypothetical protein
MLERNKIRGLLGPKTGNKRQQKQTQVVENKEKIGVLFVCMGSIFLYQ